MTSLFKIRLIVNWDSVENITKLWSKFSQDDKGTWTENNKTIKLVEDDSRDYDVVINRPPYWYKYDPKKTILLQMEPKMFEHPEVWGIWSDPTQLNLFRCLDHLSFRNNIEWHISLSYSDLINFIPTKLYTYTVSAVISDRYKDPGQIHRIDFCKFVQSEGSIPLHIYGRGNPGFKNHKGELPYHQKDSALFPYKYTINAENNYYSGYFTEKIVDAILSETLCFYWGCPDLHNYINPNSFIRIPLESSFETSLAIIRSAIENDAYSKHLPFIKEAKKTILNNLSFFPTVLNIL